MGFARSLVSKIKTDLIDKLSHVREYCFNEVFLKTINSNALICMNESLLSLTPSPLACSVQSKHEKFFSNRLI